MEKTKCPICGKGKLRREVGEFRAQFEDDSGEKREVVVRDISKNVCDVCGEFILDQESEDRISSAQRSAMGLLSAGEIAAFRKSLGKRQEEMSDLLGLGKKTWCRWESNDHFQSESLDRYVRLLIENPTNIVLLERMKRGATIEAAGKLTVEVATFTLLTGDDSLREMEDAFTEQLCAGELHMVEELRA
jgi:putative zinc finger/helix-turn-helix YgiT family protein